MKSISRTLALQVAEEAVLAGRVPQRHQVLEEGDLHGGVVDEHAAVPAEAGLLLEEVSGDCLLPADARVVLAERDSHGHIGRSEADANEVVDRLCVTRKNLRHVTPIVRGSRVSGVERTKGGHANETARQGT